MKNENEDEDGEWVFMYVIVQRAWRNDRHNMAVLMC